MTTTNTTKVSVSEQRRVVHFVFQYSAQTQHYRQLHVSSPLLLGWKGGGGGLRFAPNSAQFSYLTTMPVYATAFKNRRVEPS
jgi:hypothetical protein